jgi:CubicO group peptidase (beta-lactamase class C family)
MRNLTLACALMLIFLSCGPFRAAKWREPDLNDSAKFRNIVVQKSQNPFRFIQATGLPQYQKLSTDLDNMLKETNTNAFVVIKNDSVIYESYAPNVTANTLHPSFSVAKSYIGTLIGIAVDKGFISSTNDLVIKYLPKLAKNDEHFARLTIQHVLDMKSGFDFDEDSQSPFSTIAKLYYGTAIKHQLAKLKFKKEPGQSFEYQSINTQILAAILESVTGEKVATLLSKYLWEPLGNESAALWSTDAHQTAKAFCCLNATALDFAKLGRLYLKKWELARQAIVVGKMGCSYRKS